MKTGILLINLGTPNSPSVGDVRKYLFQFLNDPRVIDLSWLARKILVNLIIVPFRAPKSAAIYKQLWTPEGSPLLTHGRKVKSLLQEELGEDYVVELAMRYQNPGLPEVLGRMKQMNLKKIVLIPLFPHYASSSTGSALEEALRIIQKWWVIPELVTVKQFYNHPDYLNAFAERGKAQNPDAYDHVLFSFHGLPVRQLDKVYEDGKPCSDHDCENELNESNQYCYKATCYDTARNIAERLNIPKEKYTVGFQSRLGRDPWIEPFSDKVIEQKAKEGVKRLLVFSPAFIADCLETTVEIGIEYKELFEAHGGEHLQLVEGLNDHPTWIKALKDLALNPSS